MYKYRPGGPPHGETQRAAHASTTQRAAAGAAAGNGRPRPAGEAARVAIRAAAPLIRGATLTKMLQTHRSTASAATMATAVIDDPTGYGRIKRSADNRFEAIIEQTDATDDELMIREINPSYYCFSSQLLFDALARIDNDNKQREYYLTDVPALLQADGKIVTVMDTVPPEDVLSINTPQELKRVDQILRHRA